MICATHISYLHQKKYQLSYLNQFTSLPCSLCFSPLPSLSSILLHSRCLALVAIIHPSDILYKNVVPAALYRRMQLPPKRAHSSRYLDALRLLSGSSKEHHHEASFASFRAGAFHKQKRIETCTPPFFLFFDVHYQSLSVKKKRELYEGFVPSIMLAITSSLTPSTDELVLL